MELNNSGVRSPDRPVGYFLNAITFDQYVMAFQQNPSSSI
jgi:hypothetical protein